MSRLGTITLQAMDECDVFFKEDVYPDGYMTYEEGMCSLDEPGFEEYYGWIAGFKPEVTKVGVSGDTSVICGWFKGDVVFGVPFRITIYLEYEEQEEDDRTMDISMDS